MIFTSILTDYFRWHYSRAFAEIFHVWLNLLWFLIHFFSLPQLARSWFSPWKRMTQVREKTLNFEAIASYLVINVLTRLIGATLRASVICIGCLCLLLTVVFGIIVYLFWLFAPLLIIALFTLGISLLVSQINV